MYLLILESIGTQELILVGIIALVVFGPRKLPELARKFGSMMSEFRKVSGEFRSTWENAVNLEDLEEPKKIESAKENSNQVDEIENTIAQKEVHFDLEKASGETNKTKPEIRKVSKEEFENLVAEKSKETDSYSGKTIPTKSEKTDWL